MRHETIVTLRIIWEDEKYDSPTTWTWSDVAGLDEEGLTVQLIQQVAEVAEVEPVDIERFDPQFVATPELYLA